MVRFQQSGKEIVVEFLAISIHLLRPSLFYLNMYVYGMARANDYKIYIYMLQ